MRAAPLPKVWIQKNVCAQDQVQAQETDTSRAKTLNGEANIAMCMNEGEGNGPINESIFVLYFFWGCIPFFCPFTFIFLTESILPLLSPTLSV
jgi:hypothetical protein